jgi:DNA-binding response OmpR family regulator
MVRQLASRQQQENLERWLEQRGFSGNPFGIYQAELEERLAEYFVPTGYYDEIKGSAKVPRTIVVFAARGCGKSAHRIMVARDCQPTASYSEILAVPYTDFGTLPDKLAQDPKSVSLDRHLEEILRTAANTFLKALVRDASLVDALKPEWLSRLKFFCKQHPDNPVLGPLPLLDRLRQLAGGDFEPDWNVFQQAWRTGELGTMLKRQPVWDNPVARFLIALADTYPEPVNIARLSAAKRFTLFVDLVRYTGLKAVYVLVDQVDEVLPIADDLALTSDFVEPLLADLPLMECPHAAFKFFLPMEAQPAFAEKTTIRHDRLLFREIIWDEGTLAELLRQRLIAFSEGRVEALSDLCDEAEVRRGWNLDHDLVQHAQGSPRNLLRLGEVLLWTHARRSGDSISLTPGDWKLTLEEFYGTPGSTQMRPPLHPPLRLDKESQVVWVGNRKVGLSDAPFFLLSCLYDQAGQIVSNHELMTEVGSYDALRQQVRRIRQEIEPNPKHPVYLVSVRGRGLRLDNVVKRN